MKNMSYAEHVAQTILGQLGSQRFVVMTGAKNLAYFDDNGECGLCFQLPSYFAKNNINIVRIKLTFADDYTVTFYSKQGSRIAQISEHEGIIAISCSGFLPGRPGCIHDCKSVPFFLPVAGAYRTGV